MPEQSHVISLLLAIPLLAGVISLAFVRKPMLCRFIGTISFSSMVILALGLLIRVHLSANSDELTAVHSVLVSQGGSWPGPMGISLIFDHLSGLLVLATTVVALAAYLYGFSALPKAIEDRYYHPLMQFIVLGVTLSFLTGDLFNLFVSFEVMLMASYALLTLGSTKKQLAHAYKYVLLNLLASTVFVISAGMMYGLTGTLNLADLARIAQEGHYQVKLAGLESTGLGEIAGQLQPVPPGFSAVAVLILLVFATKAAVFPLWFWLPDTYWTAPAPILAFFGGVLTKVGAYAICRLFPLIFAAGDSTGVIWQILAVGAAGTMLLGAIGALGYNGIRKILSMQLIGSVGFMIFGAAVMTQSALSGAVFYMTQSMIVTTVMFMCCGLLEKHGGSDDLSRIGGLLKKDTYLGVLTFIAAMSLVGLPPLSGFFGKAMIVRAGWSPAVDLNWLTIISLIAGGLSLLAILRVWGLGLWGPSQEVDSDSAEDQTKLALANFRRANRPAYVAVTALTAIAITMGFAAQPVMNLAETAGEQLTDPKVYIGAVLGDEGVETLNQIDYALTLHGYEHLRGIRPTIDTPVQPAKALTPPAAPTHSTAQLSPVVSSLTTTASAITTPSMEDHH